VDDGIHVFTAVPDQAVGVEQQYGAWGQDMLPAGAAAAGHAGPQQPLVPVESFGLAVRMAERRGGCRALVQVSCQPVLAAAGRR
jgi:hypothetical protein